MKEPVLNIGILKPTEYIPFRIENTLEGVDQPGEWCVNTETGTIYLWPDEQLGPDVMDHIQAPKLDTVLRFAGDPKTGQPVQHITLEGIAVGYADAGMELRSAQNCTIRACHIESVAQTGIRAEGNIQNITIEQCLISDCGKDGIILDGRKLAKNGQNSHNRIEHNELYNCGQMHWQSSAISIVRSGHNQIRYNYIHDMPYAGIFVGGRRFYLLKADLDKSPDTQTDIDPDDMTIYGLKKYVPGHNRIENNFIHDVMKQLDDGGAIYCHASHHNLLKNNVVYGLHSKFALGLYFDDDEMFSTMDNNLVFTKQGDPVPHGAILSHDNACNIIQRNIAALAEVPIRTPRSYGRHMIANNIFLIRPDSKDQGDLSRNAGRYKDLKWDAGQPIMDNNIYWCPDKPDVAAAYLKTRQNKGFDVHSTVSDPHFADPKNGCFDFDTTSPAWQMGIEPIDISTVGIQSHLKAVEGRSQPEK